MKSIFMILTFVFSLVLAAQEYHPLLQTNKVWDVGFWDGNNFCEPYAIGAYYIGEDTIFEGKTYQKILSYRVEKIYNYGPGEMCVKKGADTTASFFTEMLLREEVDTKRVYKVDLTKNDPEETLFYDFSLSIGDTIHTEDFGALSVTNIESVVMPNSETRKQFTLSNNYQYTEEVGGANGLLSPLGQGVGFDYLLFCVHKKYGTETFFGGNCHPIIAGLSENKRMVSAKIFPNPVRDNLQIEGMEAGTELTITNLLGQSIMHTKLSASAQLDVSQLSQGSYYLMTDSGAALFVKVD